MRFSLFAAALLAGHAAAAAVQGTESGIPGDVEIDTPRVALRKRTNLPNYYRAQYAFADCIRTANDIHQPGAWAAFVGYCATVFFARARQAGNEAPGDAVRDMVRDALRERSIETAAKRSVNPAEDACVKELYSELDDCIVFYRVDPKTCSPWFKCLDAVERNFDVCDCRAGDPGYNGVCTLAPPYCSSGN